MEKIFSFSAQANKMGDTNSTILSCVFFCLVIIFHEFYSSISSFFRTIISLFNTPYNKKHDNAETSSKANVINSETKDVELVFDTLINFCNENGDKNIDEVELVEVFDSFEKTEPSLEEVKEAFDVFDENGDGYIDANELKKVISKMGFLDLSVFDCQRMIAPFDENRDEKIDFGEFVKLMENIFQ
ncbi:probable calcium-binding protein CML45 [Solanum lycopersicum]|uniref:EF-hand domain-containing protein n=1 Tax=Solanum lycopersicum TaxID=4081 RepID=A0A3Q7GXQ2_SOLLC|nr:probable calcium-binding protein CML30 [Solanum lycopersicum]UBK24968.1 calmodulin-like protein 36 [Solanum lycopersicum]